MSRQELYDALKKHLGSIDTDKLDEVPTVALRGVVNSIEEGRVSANEYESLMASEAARDMPTNSVNERIEEQSANDADVTTTFPAEVKYE